MSVESIFVTAVDHSATGSIKQQHYVCNQSQDVNRTLRTATTPVTGTGFCGVAVKFDSAFAMSKLVADLGQRRRLKVSIHSETAQQALVYSITDRSRNLAVKKAGQGRQSFATMSIEELKATNVEHITGTIEQWISRNTGLEVLPNSETVVPFATQAMGVRKMSLTASKPRMLNFNQIPRIMVEFNEETPTTSSSSGTVYAVWGYVRFNNTTQDSGTSSAVQKEGGVITAIGGVINSILQVGAPIIRLLGLSTNSTAMVVSSVDEQGCPNIHYTEDDDIPEDVFEAIRRQIPRVMQTTADRHAEKPSPKSMTVTSKTRERPTYKRTVISKNK